MSYTIAFTSSRKRRVFNVAGFDEEFHRIAVLVGKLYYIEIIDWMPRENTAVFACNASSIEAANEFQQELKRISSVLLRRKFHELSSMPALWVKNSWIEKYPPSSNDLEELEHYIDMQRHK